jgi:hypothetical protein
MISKSRLGGVAVVAALAIAAPVAALGVASTASAQGMYSPSENGGGSVGYNERATGPNYRLKQHGHAHHPTSQQSTNK